MVSGSEALAQALSLAREARDEFARRTAVHAVYFALFQYAGETLEEKTRGNEWRFYWNLRRPDGHLVGRKRHGGLQSGWERYLDALSGIEGDSDIRDLFARALRIRADADYDYDLDFTQENLDELVRLVRVISEIIDNA